jgi:hypothetical protein
LRRIGTGAFPGVVARRTLRKELVAIVVGRGRLLVDRRPLVVGVCAWRTVGLLLASEQVLESSHDGTLQDFLVSVEKIGG